MASGWIDQAGGRDAVRTSFPVPYNSATSAGGAGPGVSRGPQSANEMRQPRGAIRFPSSRVSLWDHSPCGPLHAMHITDYVPQIAILPDAVRQVASAVRSGAKSSVQLAAQWDAGAQGITVTLEEGQPDQHHHTHQQDKVEVVVNENPHDSDTECVRGLAQQLQHYSQGRCQAHISQVFPMRLAALAGADTQHAQISGMLLAVAQQLLLTPLYPPRLRETQVSKALELEGQSDEQGGLLTMDQARRLVLLVPDDPMAYQVPLVGVWLSGLRSIESSRVVAACLRYLYNSEIVDRANSLEQPFLLLAFMAGDSTPRAWDCCLSETGSFDSAPLLPFSLSASVDTTRNATTRAYFRPSTSGGMVRPDGSLLSQSQPYPAAFGAGDCQPLMVGSSQDGSPWSPPQAFDGHSPGHEGRPRMAPGSPKVSPRRADGAPSPGRVLQASSPATTIDNGTARSSPVSGTRPTSPGTDLVHERLAQQASTIMAQEQQIHSLTQQVDDLSCRYSDLLALYNDLKRRDEDASVLLPATSSPSRTPGPSTNSQPEVGKTGARGLAADSPPGGHRAWLPQAAAHTEATEGASGQQQLWKAAVTSSSSDTDSSDLNCAPSAAPVDYQPASSQQRAEGSTPTRDVGSGDFGHQVVSAVLESAKKTALVEEQNSPAGIRRIQDPELSFSSCAGSLSRPEASPPGAVVRASPQHCWNAPALDNGTDESRVVARIPDLGALFADSDDEGAQDSSGDARSCGSLPTLSSAADFSFATRELFLKYATGTSTLCSTQQEAARPVVGGCSVAEDHHADPGDISFSYPPAPEDPSDRTFTAITQPSSSQRATADSTMVAPANLLAGLM